MTRMRTEMDTVFEDDLLTTLKQMTEGTTIKATVVDPSGPGGGWPIVAFEGEEQELAALLMDSYGFEATEVDDWLYPVA